MPALHSATGAAHAEGGTWLRWSRSSRALLHQTSIRFFTGSKAAVNTALVELLGYVLAIADSGLRPLSAHQRNVVPIRVAFGL